MSIRGVIFMSDYRRLISYIYEYEGKEKGKNVGFVKLEARNGQCRMNLSVKRVYVGGNAIGVYLIGKQGLKTFLGNIFVRGGNGEFRATVDATNVEGTGNRLDTYYGLTVHDVKNSWRSYTTIWEDAVTAPEIMGSPLAQDVLPGSKEKDPSKIIPGVAEEIEREIEAADDAKNVQSAQPEARAAELGEENEAEVIHEEEPVHVPEQTGAEEADRTSELTSAPVLTCEPESADAQKSASVSEPECSPAEPPQPRRQPSQIQVAQSPQAQQTQPWTQPSQTQPLQSEQSSTAAPSPASEDMTMRSPELENPDILRYLQDTEDVTMDPEKLWQELRKSYPKIQPFDYEGGSEILTIRPQDIGRLPRETWVYGNNSFLLHGYYNFRYLILVRLENMGGTVRYLLGIPGHYYSNEKYMATMFGFPNFVLSKKQPPNDGRFGYWYTELKMR